MMTLMARSIIGRGTNKSDFIQGSFKDDRINGRNGNDTIFGNGGNDRLNGDNGNDRIFGGNGNDRLNGANGNDLLVGGNGNDRLNGENGNDRLSGGEGNDHLRGGNGGDAFVFDTEPNRFTNRGKIADFDVRNDSVYLDNAVFAELGSKGSLGSLAKLNKAFFTIGSAAKDANNHVIYDRKKGILLYDADGRDGEAAVEFASVNKNLKMTAADFFVI